MLTKSIRQAPLTTTRWVDAHTPPSWVSALFDAEEPRVSDISGCDCGITISATGHGDLVLLRLRYPKADAMSALDFQRAAVLTYATLREHLVGLGLHPIRFWNLIPRIRTACEDGLDRYMVFNAGRFAAYTEWYGGKSAFDAAMPTATGIGYDGEDLHVNVLAAARPGTPVENPRQRRAYRYSSRYGPMPPCFSRGTSCPNLAGLPHLVVGGTSSVVGEQSVHPGNLVAQTTETLRNMAALLEDVAKQRGCRQRSGGLESLQHMDTLRIYVLNENDVHAALAVVEPNVATLSAPIEIVRADICRPDLLVEIEGTAVFGDGDCQAP